MNQRFWTIILAILQVSAISTGSILVTILAIHICISRSYMKILAMHICTIRSLIKIRKYYYDHKSCMQSLSLEFYVQVMTS